MNEEPKSDLERNYQKALEERKRIEKELKEREKDTIDNDKDVLELDFIQMHSKGSDPLHGIRIKSNLPQHIDEILANELSSLMNSIKVISPKEINFIDNYITLFSENIKISIITEIKKNADYLNSLSKKNQINGVKSIIDNHFFNLRVLIAIATGNIENLLQLMESHKNEYEILESNYKGVNRELSIAHNKIKNRRKNQKQKDQARIEFLEKFIPEFKNKLLRQVEDCRFKNGKINFSKLSRKFGVDHKTIQSWCKRCGIKSELLY